MLNVLIVDDEISHVQGLVRYIEWEELGYAVPRTAESGEEAIEILLDSEFDVLISDVSMPGMTGIELAAEAKRLHPHIQILMISGYNEFEFVQDAIHVGAQAYVLKPLKIEEVTSRLQSFRSAIEMRKEVVEQTRELEKKVSDSVKLIKERFVDDLIAESLPVDELLASWDGLLTLPELDPGYQIIVLGLDRNPSSVQEAKQRMLLGSSFKKTVEIAFSQDDSIWLAQASFDEFVALHVNPAPAARAKAEKQYRFIQSIMREQYGASVTIGCSREGSAWEDAPLLYREIRFSMTKARLLADGQIVRGNELEPGEFAAYRMHDEFIPGLLKRLDSGDAEQVAEYMNKIKDALLSTGNASFSYAQAFAMSFLGELIRHLKWKNEPDSEGNILLWRQMLDCGSAFQLAELLAGYVQRYMDTEQKAQLNQQHNLIRRVSLFIEERLHEHWTVKQLAEHFNLNASYLSVLFKREMGRTISEFVQDTRIERARKLLQDPSIKVYEVAEQVGIQTTAYFTYLFKKLVGVTPQEYRDYGYSPDPDN
ncbi:response regulator transcription factor [Paenibacillus glycanilyticus]|uniref:Two-component sensor response regulator n=1 Tax=Paenibacillus glycanilyticus TaxID=126569 RepID=A0ABQ6GFY0_9BACL|nr:response regulator [Paenibacillus glycanilyticus]GLX69390.1 putative two-component sensor response regulator [Paenibacillus glycanilyticus]